MTETNMENTNNLPKYYQVKNTLMAEIQKGEYLPGAQLPSIAGLMRKYNVSITTAMRAMNELSREGVVNTISGKGSFVSLQKKESKDFSPANNKRLVYISPTNIGDNYFHDILLGILEVAYSLDYKLEVYNSKWDQAREMKLLSNCLEDAPAGIIFFPLSYETNYKQLFYLQKKGTRIVLVDSSIKGYEFDRVGMDFKKETKNIVNYLVKLGHKKIVFLGYRKDHSSTLEKFEGYKQALEENGIKFDNELVLDADLEEKGAGVCGFRGLKKFLSENKIFTAMVIIDTGLAKEAYRFLREKGLRVPGDVSIIGYIDHAEAANFEVPLSSISCDSYRLGYSTAKLLMRKIDDSLLKKPEFMNLDGKENISVKRLLVLRDSVKDLRNKKNK